MKEAYAAIEMAKGETLHGTVHRIMRAAVAQSLLFQQLEVLDVFTIGSRQFVRFKLDQPELVQLMTDIRKNRAVVLPDGMGYKVYLPGGRSGNVSMTKMHISSSSNLRRAYRGPKHDLWEAQFLNSKN